MKNNYVNTILLIIVLCVNPFLKSQDPRDDRADLNVFCIDHENLALNRQRWLKGDTSISSSVEKIYAVAEYVLSQGPYSVTYKTKIPPSGDKHDYMSMGPYWWPNPDTENGLPYIRRDGVVNPEVAEYRDKSELYNFTHFTFVLGLAYYFSGEERYASKASEWIKVWFDDDATKMNPNFKFAQGIPGITKGRGTGLIEARHFRLLIESINLMKRSESLTEQLRTEVTEWFKEYFNWLTSSEEGLEESEAKNNHGTWYDALAISIAIFIGDKEYAMKKIEEVKRKRIDKQIKSDGSQPHELARTKSLSYSTFNLEALFAIALEAKKLGIDLWNYSRKDKGSLRKAIDYLIPYYVKEKKWPFNQIADFEYDRGHSLILMADKYINHHAFKQYTTLIAKEYYSDVSYLLFSQDE